MHVLIITVTAIHRRLVGNKKINTVTCSLLSHLKFAFTSHKHDAQEKKREREIGR
jgi:hypothetical protein